MVKVQILGRLAKQLEIKVYGEIVIGSGTIVSNNGKDKQGKERPATFLNFKCFGNRAKVIAKYVDKGDGIYLEGTIKNANYKNKEGKMVYKDEVVVSNFEFTPGKAKGNTVEHKQAERDVPDLGDEYKDVPAAHDIYGLAEEVSGNYGKGE